MSNNEGINTNDSQRSGHYQYYSQAAQHYKFKQLCAKKNPVERQFCVIYAF